MTSPTERYYQSLIEGDTDETRDLFVDGAGDVNDPFGVGREPGFYIWAGSRHIWLYYQKGRLEPVRTTRAGSRAVVEHVLHFELRGKAVALPLAVVGEEAGDKLVRVRVYHSMWPVIGRHDVRQAILPGEPELQPPDVVGAYQAALADGDVERVLATLEPDAVVREPSGGEWVHTGAEANRRFYGAILKRGGIPLEKCTITDDGTACALEYNVVFWGEKKIWPQPGVAVYERSPKGLLAAVRIYDDVSPPE